MTALPPSVLSILESDRNGGSFSPIRSATVGEWELVDGLGHHRAPASSPSTSRAVSGAQPPGFLLTFTHADVIQCVPRAPARLASRWRWPWVVVSAASPEFWNVATQSEFLKGDVEDLSIDSDGRVFLGPSPALSRKPPRPSCGRCSHCPTARCSRDRATKARSCVLAATARCRRSSTPRSSRSTPSRRRPAAASTLPPRPDGKIYEVAPDGTSKTFFDPGRQVHLGAGGRSAPATCSPPPATKA